MRAAEYQYQEGSFAIVVTLYDCKMFYMPPTIISEQTTYSKGDNKEVQSTTLQATSGRNPTPKNTCFVDWPTAHVLHS